jgi:hypothetical protein
MAEFINTIDALGDDAVVDAIIQRTITEFRDNRLTEVSSGAFYGCASLTAVEMPSVTEIARLAFANCTSLEEVDFQNVKILEGNEYVGEQFNNDSQLISVSMPKLEQIKGGSAFYNCSNFRGTDWPELTWISFRVFQRSGIQEAVFPKVTYCIKSPICGLLPTM